MDQKKGAEKIYREEEEEEEEEKYARILDVE
jgi:hypothetical protein